MTDKLTRRYEKRRDKAAKESQELDGKIRSILPSPKIKDK